MGIALRSNLAGIRADDSKSDDPKMRL